MPQQPFPNSHHAAFSLMEMAIVLAIIGLLIGSVVGGQRLLKQAELQTVITQNTKFAQAYNQFKQQYGGLPGDLADATDYWPAVTSGNGDGQILGDERFQAWLHLASAKLVDGNFTNLTGNAVPGTNVPKGRLTNSGWAFNYKASTSADGTWFDEELDNMLAFGAPNGALTNGKLLTPADAWQLDTKMDDGLPGVGNVVALKPNSCVLAGMIASDSAYTYNKPLQNAACNLNITLNTKN